MNLQKAQLDMAAKRSVVDYSKARRLGSLLFLLAVPLPSGSRYLQRGMLKKVTNNQKYSINFCLTAIRSRCGLLSKTLKLFAVNEAASRQYGFSNQEFLTIGVRWRLTISELAILALAI